LQRVVRAIPGPPSARDLPPHPAPAMALARVCLLGALGGAAAGGDLRGGMAQGARASRALGGDTGAATEALAEGPATLSPGLSFVLGMCAVAGVVAICWAVVMCRRRQVRAAEQQHQAEQDIVHSGGNLPVLLGARNSQAMGSPPRKDGSMDEEDYELPPKSLPEFLRATINSVQEGLDWNDNDLHVEPPDAIPSHDCTRGCDVSCW